MNHEDTSKGNGSRGARHEYSLSGNVTWVHRPPCFFGTGGVDGCSFPVYPRVIASGSIMSIDEIFFSGGGRKFVLPREEETEDEKRKLVGVSRP